MANIMSLEQLKDRRRELIESMQDFIDNQKALDILIRELSLLNEAIKNRENNK